MIVDRHGTPLAVSLTGGNRHDVTQLIPLLDTIAPIRGRPAPTKPEGEFVPPRPLRLFARCLVGA